MLVEVLIKFILHHFCFIFVYIIMEAQKAIWKALEFAAHKHKNQFRKGAEQTPYINHPIKVAGILNECGEQDAELIMAALLHDTVEDTDTSAEELQEHFGSNVANIVMECTDDKNLSKAERKSLQIQHAPTASKAAKKLKIADKICNISDICDCPPKGWSIQRKVEYLDWCEAVFAGCRGVSDELENHFLEVLAESRSRLQLNTSLS